MGDELGETDPLATATPLCDKYAPEQSQGDRPKVKAEMPGFILQSPVGSPDAERMLSLRRKKRVSAPSS